MTFPFRSRTMSLLTLGLVAAAPLAAQESTGQVVGTIRSKAGAPMPGVQVRLTSPALQGARVVVTDDKGAYRAPLLPPGSYSLVALKDGFLSQGGRLDLNLGQVVRLDLTMAPQETASTTVEVISSASNVDKTEVKAATNITSEFMDTMPRFTRGLDTAALLAPGIATRGPGQGEANKDIIIRGGTAVGNRFLLNGTDIADNVFAQSNGRSYYVDDSIQEIQVIQSPVNARFGNFTGGVINAITKSGGNEFTGIIRGNFNKTSWQAQAPRGTRPSLIPANGGTGATEDTMTSNYTVQLGGPIIKDRLWFSGSTKQNPTSVVTATYANPSSLTTYYTGLPAYTLPTMGQSYSRVSSLQFYEGKLTWAINSDHTLEVGQTRSVTTGTNQLTGNSFDPDTLYDRQDINEYKTIGYRGLLTQNMTIEARYAKKADTIVAGGDLNRPFPQRIDALYGNGVYYRFNNATFSKLKPDQRDATTYTVNLSWFPPQTSFGTHVIEAGLERVISEFSSANDQSPTNTRIFVGGRLANGNYEVQSIADDPDQAVAIQLYLSSAGFAKTTTQSFYLNDTATFSDHLQLMLGVRFDSSKAADTFGAQTISSSKWSPRLQLTYDPRGDQTWVARASYATYVGKLHDGLTSKFTFAGNPLSELYGYRTTNLNATYAQVVDLNNWDLTPNGFLGATGSTGTLVNPNLKAPSVDEISVGIRRNYKDGSFLNLSYNKRTYKDPFDDFLYIGDELQQNSFVTPGVVLSNPVTRWDNNPHERRDYSSVELEFLQVMTPRWSFGGNYTSSSLKGNGEGGDNSAVSRSVASLGDPLGNYESVHALRGRDQSYYAPYGYLASDTKHRGKLYLNYVNQDSKGAMFSSSLLLNYTGGGVYDISATNLFEAQTDAAAAGSPNVNAYPTTYTRYWGRGLGRFNDVYSVDLKLAVQIPLFRKVRYFTELTITNLFNHQLLQTFSTATTGTAQATNSPKGGYYTAPWGSNLANRTGWGTYGNADYLNARVVTLSTGFKW